MTWKVKGLLRDLFIWHDLHNKSKSEREALFDKIVKVFFGHGPIRSQTQRKVERHLVHNFLHFYQHPIVENEDKFMPVLSGDGSFLIDELENKPKTEADIINRDENASPGTKGYWYDIIKFDDMQKAINATSTDDCFSYHAQVI